MGGLTLAALGGPLLAGLAGSPHCVGMCGGFAVAAAGGPRGRASALAWSAGRLSTYAVLGALVGAFGGALPGPGWVGTAIAAAFLVYFAARLAGLVFGLGALGMRGMAPAAVTSLDEAAAAPACH